MTEYQTLALQYAEAVREYAELELHCRTSDLRQDQAAKRNAYDVMCNMQNALYFAAQELVAA